MSKKKFNPKKFMAKWWPVFFAGLYLLIMFGGAAVKNSPVLAVDECETFMPSCEVVAKAEVLSSQDKFEHIKAKPQLGNYRTFTYSVLKWGEPSVDAEEFASMAAETMKDPRGWSQGGISFSRVASGGDFTLVISEPSYLGNIPGCSADWSCRSGRYVIINEIRWNGATDAWNNAGGDLRNYRHMVINHETGHFLGHGHPPESFYCTTPAPAPVMLQQSIDLRGCLMNPWPLLYEIEALQ